MLKNKAFLAVLILPFLWAPLPARAAELTYTQIDAIIALLQSFGVSEEAVYNVGIILTNQKPMDSQKDIFKKNLSKDRGLAPKVKSKGGIISTQGGTTLEASTASDITPSSRPIR